MNDRFVIKRGWNQVCMFIVTIAAILLLCAKQQILLDQILGIVCVAMIWFVLFLFFIEHDRAEGLISHNRETDFKKYYIVIRQQRWWLCLHHTFLNL